MAYQLLFERPERGSPQLPSLPVPKSVVVQSFNTAAGGPKNFDLYMGAGGYGAFNACYDDVNYEGTSTFGVFAYDDFPWQYPTTGGIKTLNLDECKVDGQVTVASMSAARCQDEVGDLCDQADAVGGPGVTATTRDSCALTNEVDSFYHQNWQVRAKRVSCPEGLTRVTGCRLDDASLPAPDPSVQTVADDDGTWTAGYTTTTMQDCCKPTCAWDDNVGGKGLRVDGDWASFYSCDVDGAPLTE